MSESNIHENEAGFDEFVEEALKKLRENAEAKGICLDCLSDRLIVELVAGMARSGAPKANILAAVGDGLDAVEVEAEAEQHNRSGRVH